MPWIRQLPSGLWAATVRTPTGRLTETDRLKSVVTTWACDREAEVRRGDWIDPRDADITVGAWWERCKGARHLELASRKRDESHWRCHVEPKWGRVKLASILKPDVSAWVVQMQSAHKQDCEDRRMCRGCLVGAATIEGAVGVLRSLLELAVDARLLRVNPARKVSTPARDAHVDRILSAAEEASLLDRLDVLFGGRPDGRLFVELMLDTGMRWEEAAAVDREHVDLRRRLVHVGPVMERDGTIRPYPKTPAGVRSVPVSEQLWPMLRDHVLTVPPGGLVVTAARGGGLRYSNWLRQVWKRALCLEVPGEAAERPKGRPGPAPKAVDQVTYLADPQPTPHDLRHSFGTRLADNGVPPHDIMALMGHENLRSVQRYLHSGEDRFDRARRALDAARGRASADRPSGQVDEFGK